MAWGHTICPLSEPLERKLSRVFLRWRYSFPLLRLLRVDLCIICTSGVQKKTVKCSVVWCCSLMDTLGFYKRCCARNEGVIISFENWHLLMWPDRRRACLGRTIRWHVFRLIIPETEVVLSGRKMISGYFIFIQKIVTSDQKSNKILIP
jgi:hypothetical protein